MGSSFGQTIRMLRHERGVTLADVAEATGLSVALLSRLERGQRNPTPESAAQLAAYFAVPVHRLNQLAASASMQRWNSDATGIAEPDVPGMMRAAAPRAHVRRQEDAAAFYAMRPIGDLFGEEPDPLLLALDTADDAVRDATRTFWQGFAALSPTEKVLVLERLGRLAEEPLDAVRHVAAEDADPAVKKAAHSLLRRMER